MTNAYKVNAFINDIQAYSEDALSVMIKDNNVIDVKKLFGLIDCKINGLEEENIKR